MLVKKPFLVLALLIMLLGMGFAFTSNASEKESLSLSIKSLSFNENWQVPTSLYGEPLQVAKAKFATGVYEGRPVIALRLMMSAGWHSYWYFPGAAGIAPRFEWGSSPYISAGEPLFLPPKRYNEPGGPTYGYDGETVIFIPFTFNDTLENGGKTAFPLSLTLTLGPVSYTHLTLPTKRIV